MITRYEWRIHGDLLCWIATEFPGLGPQAFEGVYRLLAKPDLPDKYADEVCGRVRRHCEEMAELDATMAPVAAAKGCGGTLEGSDAPGSADSNHACVDEQNEQKEA